MVRSPLHNFGCSVLQRPAPYAFDARSSYLFRQYLLYFVIVSLLNIKMTDQVKSAATENMDTSSAEVFIMRLGH